MVTGLLELVFENDDVLVTEANDHIRLDTCFFKRLCGRICDCTTDAAANYAHALFAFNVRRLTEWADKVLNNRPRSDCQAFRWTGQPSGK